MNSHSSEIDMIKKRLLYIENQNRFLRRTIALIFLCAISFLLMAQFRQDRFDFVEAQFVQTKSLDVMDSNGKKRLEFGEFVDGSVGFISKDKSNKMKLFLGVDKRGDPKISFYDVTGTERMLISLFGDYQPSIFLRDKNGDDKVMLNVYDHESHFLLYGKDNSQAWIYPPK